jgi:hypothetical protein
MFTSHAKALLVAAATVAASLSAARSADLCLDTAFRCNGFEPNWQFTATEDDTGSPVVSFTDPENPDWQSAPLVVGGRVRQGSPNDFEVTTDEPLSLVANIVGQSCTEPNEEVTDFSVTVTFNQGAQTPAPNRVEGTGCCRILE